MVDIDAIQCLSPYGRVKERREFVDLDYTIGQTRISVMRPIYCFVYSYKYSVDEHYFVYVWKTFQIIKQFQWDFFLCFQLEFTCLS